MVTADLGSVGDGRHVAQLLAQLVQLLHGHLGGGGGERGEASTEGGGGERCGDLKSVKAGVSELLNIPYTSNVRVHVRLCALVNFHVSYGV